MSRREFFKTWRRLGIYLYSVYKKGKSEMVYNKPGSKSWSLNWDDMKKIGKGLFIAVAGAALTFVSTEVLPDLQNETGIQMILFAAFSALVNTGRKWVVNNSK